RVPITPEEPMWMSGFSGRTAPASTTSLELFAKALAIEDPRGHRAVLVTLDIVGLDRATTEAICSALEAKHGLRRDQVCLNCSHTHCGPVVGRNLWGMFMFDDAQWQLVDDYNQELREKVIAVVGEALAVRAPATLQFATGSLDFAINRRTNPRKPDELAAQRAGGGLKGPSDHDLPVLTVAAEDGKLTAIVGLYACHATILAFDQWSGDWPGYAQQHLERAHPGAIAMFVAGCGGDQAPWPREPETTERADDYGRRFAAEVETVLRGKPRDVAGHLVTRYREIDLPLAAPPTRVELAEQVKSKNRFIAHRATVELSQLDRGDALPTSYPYPVQVWRLGDELRFVALGGEVVVDYALRIKRELGADRTWVAGYSNDVMAYIPSERVLAEGGYEGATSMMYYGLPTTWAPGLEQLIDREVRRQAK
ncbi:MAG TPA: neutral/alkaline non-lysosomal ceramidase N-terminal domain-containing protein, partial [Pirellulales bacterium]|nr:neutral/alkaline non-lysosomal ceramidase N-terminal domain-containing protein [Pirellulales bacterium]